MKTFKYTGRKPFDRPGSNFGAEPVNGVIEANSRSEAIDRLKQNGLIVTDIEETTDNKHDIDLRIGGRKAKEKSLAITCNQFGIILQAGLPMVRALQLVSDQTEDKVLKGIFANAADDVAAGYGLADSLERQGDGLPTTFVESVRAGEESGSLDVVFDRLSRYYEKNSKSKSKVKSALMYPAFVMVVAVVVVAIIMIVAVPTFMTTFQGMGVELPWPTRFLIGVSNFMTKYTIYIVIGAIALFLIVQLAKRYNEDFHLWWSRLGTRVPVLGRVTCMNTASQYAGTMSIMMGAGLSVVRAIDVTSKTLSNYYMAQRLSTMIPDLEAGRPLAQSLIKTEAFPDLVCEMTGVGEQTGTLEHTLEVIGEYYDNEVETATNRAVALLEPAIIVFLALIVFLVLIAVYMPMFSLYGSF